MAAAKKVKGKVINTSCLSYTASHAGSVMWSSDDRIAVITEQCVYIITLLFAEKNNKPAINFTLSSIPCQEKYLPMDVGVSLSSFESYREPVTPTIVNWLMNYAINPSKMAGVSKDSNAFKSLEWSPLGCDPSGRCVLATLCMDYRLNLYLQTKPDTKWYEVGDISTPWQEHCKKHNYLGIIKRNRESTDAINGIQEAGHCISLLQFTCITWCPMLLRTAAETGDNIKKFAILAAATRSGHISFWKVAVPILDKASVEPVGVLDSGMKWSCSADWFSCTDTEGLLAVGNADGLIQVYGLQIQILSASDTCMSVSGELKCVLWGDKDEMAVNWLRWAPQQDDGKVSLFACKTSVVIRFSLPVHDVKVFKNPVCYISQGIHSAPITGLSVSRGGSAFTCATDSTLQRITIGSPEPEQIIYEAKSVYTCYGVAASPNGLYLALLHVPGVISLQVKNIVSQVQVSIVSLVTKENLSKTISSLAPSGTISWDIKEALRQYLLQGDHDVPIICAFMDRPTDTLTLSCLYIRHSVVCEMAKHSNNSSRGHGTGCDWETELWRTTQQIVKRLMTSVLCSWLEYYEHVQERCADRTSALLMSDWLVINYTDGDSLDLAVRVYTACDDTYSAGIAPGIRRDAAERPVDRSTDRGVVKLDKDSGLETSNCMEGTECEPAKQTQHIMQTSGETTSEVNHCGNQLEGDADGSNTVITASVAKAIASTCTGEEAQPSSNVARLRLPDRETCPLCKSGISLSDVSRGMCTSGHSWKRCLASYRVCADFTYHSCQDCGGCVSLPSNHTSPWLRTVLQEVIRCPMCQGWF